MCLSNANRAPVNLDEVWKTVGLRQILNNSQWINTRRILLSLFVCVQIMSDNFIYIRQSYIADIPSCHFY